MNILRLSRITFLFSNAFGVWMLTASKREMMLRTSCTNVSSIKHMASAVFITFRLVLLSRERENYIRFSQQPVIVS